MLRGIESTSMPLATNLLDEAMREVRHGRGSSARRISGAPKRFPDGARLWVGEVVEKDEKGRAVS